MELLKTTRSQLAPLLRSISPAARIVAAVALLFAVSIGLYYCNQSDPAENVYLFGGRELAATEIVALETALGKAGQNAYEVVENRVLVPQDQRAAILRVIEEAGATPRSITGYDSAPTTFSPFSTGQQQRNQDKAKKQEKICAMIREIQGIEYVLVEYDETRSEGFPRTTERTAAVTARPAAGRHLEPFEIKTIRATVQRAVAGLQPEDIVVIDGNSGIAHDWQDQESAVGTLKDYATAKQYHEDAWKQKIENVLNCYPAVRVDVLVELEQEERADAGAPLASVQTTSRYQSSSSQTYPNTGRAAKSTAAVAPGSNGHARIQEVAFSAQKPALTAAISETNPIATDRRDYVPASASVSIGVPTSCVCQLAIAKLRTEPEPGADPAESNPLSQSQIIECFEQIKIDIMNRVAPLLPGHHPSRDRIDYISVSLDPDIASVGEVAAAPNNDEMQYFAHFNSHWYALLIPVAFAAGVILIRIGNRTHLLPVPSDHDALAAQADAALSQESNDRPNGYHEILHNDLEPTEKEIQLATDIDRAFESDYQASLSSELVETVENDPRATISVFRSWLADAA